MIACDLRTGQLVTAASDLPVGIPDGVEPKYPGPIPGMAGPIGLFAAMAKGPDGTIYVSGDAESSVLALMQIAATN